MTTTVERLARVEEQVTALKEEVHNLKADVAGMNQKLDDLLALRYKGAGAFWLASALLGTSFIGALAQIIHWVKS